MIIICLWDFLHFIFILTLILHFLYLDLDWYSTWLDDQDQWWRQLKIYCIKPSWILTRLYVLYAWDKIQVLLRLIMRKNIIMGLSRSLKNEWVIFVKSFVLHGHNDAHATNSLFKSNLFIFTSKLVGKVPKL